MFFRVNHFILPAYLLPLFCPSQSNRIKDFSFCVPCRRGLPAASDAFRQTYSTFRYCITLFGLDWFGLDWFGLDWIGLVLPSRVFSGILGYSRVFSGMLGYARACGTVIFSCQKCRSSNFAAKYHAITGMKLERMPRIFLCSAGMPSFRSKMIRDGLEELFTPHIKRRRIMDKRQYILFRLRIIHALKSAEKDLFDFFQCQIFSGTSKF